MSTGLLRLEGLVSFVMNLSLKVPFTFPPFLYRRIEIANCFLLDLRIRPWDAIDNNSILFPLTSALLDGMGDIFAGRFRVVPMEPPGFQA